MELSGGGFVQLTRFALRKFRPFSVERELWILLLEQATYESTTRVYLRQDEPADLPPCTVLASLRELAKVLGRDKLQIKRALQKFQKLGFVRIEAKNRARTLIYLLNSDAFFNRNNRNVEVDSPQQDYVKSQICPQIIAASNAEIIAEKCDFQILVSPDLSPACPQIVQRFHAVNYMVRLIRKKSVTKSKLKAISAKIFTQFKCNCHDAVNVLTKICPHKFYNSSPQLSSGANRSSFLPLGELLNGETLKELPRNSEKMLLGNSTLTPQQKEQRRNAVRRKLQVYTRALTPEERHMEWEAIATLIRQHDPDELYAWFQYVQRKGVLGKVPNAGEKVRFVFKYLLKEVPRNLAIEGLKSEAEARTRSRLKAQAQDENERTERERSERNLKLFRIQFSPERQKEIIRETVENYPEHFRYGPKDPIERERCVISFYYDLREQEPAKGFA